MGDSSNLRLAVLDEEKHRFFKYGFTILSIVFNKIIFHLVLFVFVFFAKLIFKNIYFGFCFTCFFCHPFFPGVPKHRYAW